jgi:hypothetical protein
VPKSERKLTWQTGRQQNVVSVDKKVGAKSKEQDGASESIFDAVNR